jgi:hypothetical protein
LIFRTRGTTDASILPNGHEIEFLKQKYPKVFALRDITHSILFEWTTPSNRIVLSESEEPTLWLIGVVRHSDYSYFEQRELDAIAKELEVPRPERFQMDLLGIKNFLETNQTMEGVVVYANKGQYLKKIKTPRYLYLHKVFTGIKTFNNLFDLWCDFNNPEIPDFKQQLIGKFDYELVVALDPLLTELEEKYTKFKNKLKEIEVFVREPSFAALTRKEQAVIILDKYKDWSGVAFNTLSKKTNPLSLKLFNLV